MGNYKIDFSLIIALVERWKPETHTFHFPTSECIVTLEDDIFGSGSFRGLIKRSNNQIKVVLGLSMFGNFVIISCNITFCEGVQYYCNHGHGTTCCSLHQLLIFYQHIHLYKEGYKIFRRQMHFVIQPCGVSIPFRLATQSSNIPKLLVNLDDIHEMDMR
ncbi:Serine/threonine-protein phosphatase 7 long form-like protein, partial [Mucuna pruriens]